MVGGSCDQNPWFNLDLTATKKLGKMEIGAIAYGSWDYGLLETDCKKASEFAIGGLVGYDFGSFIAQAKLAGDVQSENTTLQRQRQRSSRHADDHQAALEPRC